MKTKTNENPGKAMCIAQNGGVMGATYEAFAPLR